MQRSLLLGVPLSIVLPLQGSLCVVLGTSVNYVLQPPARSEPTILFCGVAAFLAAIALSAAAHLAHEREADADGERERRRGQTACARLLLPDAPLDSAGQQPAAARRVSSHGLRPRRRGRLLLRFFTPAFNLAVNDELGWAAAGGGRPLVRGEWLLRLAFAASAWVSTSRYAMAPPARGARRSPSTSTAGGGSGRGRALAFALLAGAALRARQRRAVLGRSLAGFAAADLVQAYPLVSTLWGMGLFGEFRGASRRVCCLLAAMYSSFVAAVALLALSVR